MDIILNTHFNNPNLPVVQIPGFYDDFTGTPSETSLGRTSRDNRLWEYPNGSGWMRDPEGYARTDTNDPTGRSNIAVVDGIASTGVLSVRVHQSSTAGNNQIGIAFNASGPDTFLAFVSTASNSSLRLYANTPGNTSIVAETSGSINDGDVVSARFDDQIIHCFVNDSLIFEHPAQPEIQGTKHGLYAINRAEVNASFDWVEYVA